jgi:hypothetical protein
MEPTQYLIPFNFLKIDLGVSSSKNLAANDCLSLIAHSHSERNVRFRLDRASAALGPNGVLVVDDVDANWGLRSFTQTFSGHQSLICEAKPLHPI